VIKAHAVHPARFAQRLRSSWREGFVALLLLAPWASGPAAGPQAVQTQVYPPDPVQALGAGIRQIIEAPRFRAATWGIEVVSLDTGRVLFEHNAGKYLVPASNTKLFTAAMALQELGPALRIRTSLYGSARPGADGTLRGDLILFGRGDPTLMRPWKGGPFQADPMEALAQQLQDQGVRAIQGDLVGDDSYFAEPPYGPGWEWEDLKFAYGAEPTALTLHHNVVDLWVYPAPAAGQPCFLFAQPGQGLIPFRNDTRTAAAGPGIRAERLPGESSIRVTGSLAPGSAPVRLTMTVHDAALWSAGLLRRALARRGIEVLGQVKSAHYQDREPPLETARLVELGHLDSPPLLEILRELLKNSNNLYAQLTLLQAGARRSGQAGTVHQGLLAMAAWMARAGLRPEDSVLEEGSGLSRKNLLKPDGIIQLLAYMDRQPEAASFRALLPLAGVDGTLRLRMQGGAAQGNLSAKTGTMRNTHALSGYVTSAGGERLAFAILLNNDHGAASGEPAAPSVLDRIAELLARLPASARAPE
jgi:D-alanyl-D-alanine carboxypeptidase/D-alanyl-D-alanine-endopeptidase (penicillin-binding protein 4)